MVSPYPGDLVEQRLIGVAVLDDVDDREVGDDVGVHQREHCQRGQREADQGAGPADRHPAYMAPGGADHRDGRLDHGDKQRQDQREVA